MDEELFENQLNQEQFYDEQEEIDEEEETVVPSMSLKSANPLADCVYYMSSTCNKICGYRHCEAAKESKGTCDEWKNYRCTDVNCPLKHPSFKTASRGRGRGGRGNNGSRGNYGQSRGNYGQSRGNYGQSRGNYGRGRGMAIVPHSNQITTLIKQQKQDQKALKKEMESLKNDNLKLTKGLEKEKHKREQALMQGEMKESLEKIQRDHEKEIARLTERMNRNEIQETFREKMDVQQQRNDDQSRQYRKSTKRDIEKMKDDQDRLREEARKENEKIKEEAQKNQQQLQNQVTASTAAAAAAQAAANARPYYGFGQFYGRGWYCRSCGGFTGPRCYAHNNGYWES